MPTLIKYEPNTKLLAREFTRNLNNSICNALIYKPVNIEEIKLGDLFIVGEINQDADLTVENTNIINRIFSQIKKEYYRDYKRDSRKSFEESVKKANTFFAEIVSEKKYFNVQNINFIIAAYSNQLFHFTACGKAKIFLMRADAILEIEKKLFIEKKIYAPKIFTNIATGRLAKEDFLILATSLFPELFSPAAIKTFVENNSFEKTCEYILDTLQKDKKQSSYGLVAIKVATEENIPTIRYSYEELKNATNSCNPNRIGIIGAIGNVTEKQNINNADNYKSKILFLKNSGNDFFKKRLPKVSRRIKTKLLNIGKHLKYFFKKLLILKDTALKYSRNDAIHRKKTTIIATLTILFIAAVIIYFLMEKSTVIIK